MFLNDSTKQRLLAGTPWVVLLALVLVLPPGIVVSADEQAELAIAHFKLGREQEAARGFEAVLQVSPTHHRGNFGAAVLALKQKREVDALKHLRTSYGADPTDADVGLSLSALLIDGGQYQAAKDILMPLHKAEPRDARVVKNLAETSIGLREYAQSLAFFKQYLVLVPNAPNRATVERKMRRLEAKLAK